MSITVSDFMIGDNVHEYVRVSFNIYTNGDSDPDDRYLTTILLGADFNGGRNVGNWCGGSMFINALAWSGQGKFKRSNHSLYFYSDDTRKGCPQSPDFVLHYAPAEPHDYLANRGGIVRDGVGRIINPRNPQWAGTQIEWTRTDVQPDDGSSEDYD